MGITYFLYFASLFANSAATFTCPTLFNWYPDTNDCSRFYRCVWGTSHSFTCPKGTLWSHEYLTCDFEDHVRCYTDREKENGHRIQYLRQEATQESPDFSVDYYLDSSSHKDSASHPDDTASQSLEGREINNKNYKMPTNEFKNNPKHIDYDLNGHAMKADSKRHKDTCPYKLINVVHSQNKLNTVHRMLNDYTHVNSPTYPHYFSDNSPSSREFAVEGLKQSEFDIDNQHASDSNAFYPDQENGDVPENYELEYDDSHNNNNLNTEYDSENELDVIASDERPLNHLFREHDSSEEHTFEKVIPQHQPSSENINSQTPSTDGTQQLTYPDSGNKYSYRDFILDKLRQRAHYSDLHPHSSINTDGTYDVLDMAFFPRQHDPTSRDEPYITNIIKVVDPWTLTDFFRAGYGYKRIYP